jgi:hypothetical protein
MSIDGRLAGFWGIHDANLGRRPRGGPSGALLRPDGPAEPHPAEPHPDGPSPTAPQPPVDARRTLARDALRILARLRAGGPLPDPWTAAAFGREVDYVRAHLRPIRTRAMLAASFGREAFHVPVLRDPEHGVDRGLESAVRVAYAIRWLELGDEQTRPRWPELTVAATLVPARSR